MWTGVTKAPFQSSSLPSILIGFCALGIRPTMGFSWAEAVLGRMAPRKTIRVSECKRCVIFFNLGANGAANAGLKNTIPREPEVFNQKSYSEERFLFNLLGHGSQSLPTT